MVYHFIYNNLCFKGTALYFTPKTLVYLDQFLSPSASFRKTQVKYIVTKKLKFAFSVLSLSQVHVYK